MTASRTISGILVARTTTRSSPACRRVMRAPLAAYRKDVWGSSMASCRASRSVGRSHAEAARAQINKVATNVARGRVAPNGAREVPAMGAQSSHGGGVPTASIASPMGPADLPTLLAGRAGVVPEDGLREKLELGRPLRV